MSQRASLPSGWISEGQRHTSLGIEERLRYRGSPVKLVYSNTSYRDGSSDLENAVVLPGGPITVTVESSPGVQYTNRADALNGAKTIVDRLIDTKTTGAPKRKIGRSLLLIWIVGELAVTGFVGYMIATATERPWSPRLSLRPKRQPKKPRKPKSFG